MGICELEVTLVQKELRLFEARRQHVSMFLGNSQASRETKSQTTLARFRIPLVPHIKVLYCKVK